MSLDALSQKNVSELCPEIFAFTWKPIAFAGHDDIDSLLQKVYFMLC